MSVLTDEDLTGLLAQTAEAYDVPPDGPEGVLAELSDPGPVPLRGRRWVQVAAVAAVVVGAFAGGALLDAGGRGEPATMTAAPAADQAAPVSGPQEVGSGALAVPESADRLTDTSAGPAPAAALSSAISDRNTSAGGGFAAPPVAEPAPPGVQAPPPDGARIVKTGSLALIVADGRVTPTLTAVQELATAAGGVVASAETQESGSTPSGSVTLRVPVGEFEQVVTRVRSLDAEVRTATTSGRDVTAEYTDVEAQLRTLRAARERFLEILGQTRAIGDILAVQQRVDDVTGQIDRLEGQRQLLQAQSEMSTLTVSVTEADDPVVRVDEEPDDGLSKAFRDAWDGFTSGVEGLVAASGRAVLVLLCLVLAVVVLRLGWRIGRRRLV